MGERGSGNEIAVWHDRLVLSFSWPKANLERETARLWLQFRQFVFSLWLVCVVFIARLTVSLTMEGSNSKTYKSRLFTSNVLLQKDELEEVSAIKTKVYETKTGVSLTVGTGKIDCLVCRLEESSS